MLFNWSAGMSCLLKAKVEKNKRMLKRRYFFVFVVFLAHHTEEKDWFDR